MTIIKLKHKFQKITLLASVFAVSLAINPANAADPVTVWAWNTNVPVLKQAAELYKQTHPDITISVQDIGRTDLYTKLSVGLQAKGAGLPDLLLVEDDHLQGYLENWPNGFANLSKLGFDSHAKEFPLFKQKVTQIKGQFHAMPFDIGPVGIFYRPSYFEKAGVDPKTIETWNDFIAAGKMIKEKTGANMLNIFSDDDGLFRMMMNQQGVYFYDSKGNIDFTNPKVIKALTMMGEMNKAGIVYTGSKGWDGFVQAIAQSKIVAIPSGAWIVGTITSQAPETKGDWAVMPMPKMDKEGSSAANIGGSNFVIPVASKNAQAAYDFMRYFTTSVEVQKIAFEGGFFPSYLPIYKDPVFSQPVPFFNNQQIWSEIAKVVPHIAAADYTFDYAMGQEESIKAQTEVVMNGVEPKKALQEAAKRLGNRTYRKVNKY